MKHFLLNFTFLAMVVSVWFITACDHQEPPTIANNVILPIDTVESNSTGQFMSIESSENWVISADYGDFGPWCTISPISGSGSTTITLSYSPNETAFTRTVKINVLFKSTTATVEFSQKRGAVNTLESDQVNKWMELPEVSTNGDIAYISHHTSILSKPYRNYSTLYDGVNKIALWVAYPLNYIYLGNSGRTDAWAWNPKIPQQYQVDLSKSFLTLYGFSGYDRGHQIPSADRTASNDVNDDTFYYTNMTAQHSSFNSNIWGELETTIRNWSGSMGTKDTLYIVTGPLLTEEGKTEISYVKDKSGNIVCALPKGYFKIVLKYVKSTDKYSSIGFMFRNEGYGYEIPRSQDIFSVKQVEERTGFRFFTNLPADIRESVISQRNLSEWGFSN